MPARLSLLLDVLGINHATVVAEVNGQIVKRGEFDTTELADGQRLELVRFVGGG